MRKMILSILLFPVLFGCNTNDLVTGKETHITLQYPFTGDKTPPSTEIEHLHLFTIDRNNTVIHHETFTQKELNENTITANLPLGKYKIALVANAPNEEEITFKLGESLENVLLHLSGKENETREAPDFLTALQSVSITENGNPIPPVRLSRRVGMLRITLNNIPAEAHDMNIELSFVPSALPLTGSGSNTFGKITRPVEVLHDRITTDLFTFPTRKGEANLSVNYREEGKQKQKQLPLNESIDTNTIVHLTADFQTLPEGGMHGNGINLLENGDFEQWSHPDQEPDYWKFYKDGKDSTVVKVSGTWVHSGKQAARLEGKTYLYQDVPVKEGQRYEIKMHVNSPSPDFPWKYYCYWRKNASTALPSEENKPIQAQSYLKQTEGWVNVFNGRIFPAPVGAKYLRVEIRTYGKEITPGEGVYIDDWSVELVE